MCQLLGVSSNKHVDIQLPIREFRHRGETNPHGWGFAFFQDNAWKVIKEPRKLSCENVTDSRFHFKSNIIIGHVRFATCGDHIHENTHPFTINSWVFAHNGTVKDIKNKNGFELTKYQPEGETDTEYAFCYLLEKIVGHPENIGEILKSESDKIRQLEHGRFNYLLYRWNNPVCLRRRQPLHGEKVSAVLYSNLERR